MDTIVMDCHLSLLPRSSHRPILRIKRFVGILINILLPQGSLLSVEDDFPCSVLCLWLISSHWHFSDHWPRHDSDQSSHSTNTDCFTLSSDPFWVRWSAQQSVERLFEKYFSYMFDIVLIFLSLPIEHKKCPTFKSSHVSSSLTMFESSSDPDSNPSCFSGLEFLHHEVRWSLREVVCGRVRSVYF